MHVVFETRLQGEGESVIASLESALAKARAALSDDANELTLSGHIQITRRSDDSE